jgi:hypothetical protein
MKFGKELKSFIQSQNNISYENWFEYKSIKKCVNNIIINYPNIINNIKTYKYNYDNNECCICLENKNLMKLFCCHNFIHHKCLVNSLAFCNSNCPLCRKTIHNVLAYDKNNIKECFDIEVISLIGIIHKNILKIEEYCKNNTDNKFIKDYKKLNYKAIIKICKKIKKSIAIDLKDYFVLKFYFV